MCPRWVASAVPSRPRTLHWGSAGRLGCRCTEPSGGRNHGTEGDDEPNHNEEQPYQVVVEALGNVARQSKTGSADAITNTFVIKSQPAPIIRKATTPMIIVE